MSSFRYGPIYGQHSRWSAIGQVLSVRDARSQKDDYAKEGEKLKRKHVLIICGDKDYVVKKDEVFQDAGQVLGGDKVEFRSCDAGHELPMTRSTEILGMIQDFLP